MAKSTLESRFSGKTIDYIEEIVNNRLNPDKIKEIAGKPNWTDKSALGYGRNAKRALEELNLQNKAGKNIQSYLDKSDKKSTKQDNIEIKSEEITTKKGQIASKTYTQSHLSPIKTKRIIKSAFRKGVKSVVLKLKTDKGIIYVSSNNAKLAGSYANGGKYERFINGRTIDYRIDNVEEVLFYY